MLLHYYLLIPLLDLFAMDVELSKFPSSLLLPFMYLKTSVVPLSDVSFLELQRNFLGVLHDDPSSFVVLLCNCGPFV